MAEEDDSPQFLEVTCRTSGKTLRFAPGTDAGFAVALINRKLKGTLPIATHIEAVKDGKEEETIAFGSNAILSNFGHNWKLQTVLSSEQRKGMAKETPRHVAGGKSREPNQISSAYIVKIILAFILIFVLGAIFTLFLDNLPELIVFVKSMI
ncbi:transmembrane protein, putative [Medicago truncatula]|uniref:Transmembrane protein, putative n=1 Tax=Medicago truncatula TaxID=3880 RepID=A0A072UIA7_MEDTR|nr:transmembrane protein, putative [Medicago truncatula]